MPRYYNEITGQIVDYPEDAAAEFPALKPVPSERSKTKAVEVDATGTEYVIDIEPADPKTKNGEVENAK